MSTTLHVPLNPPEFEGGKAYPSGYTAVPQSTGDDTRSTFQKMKDMDMVALLRYMRYTNVGLSMFQGLTGFLGLFDLARLNITSFLIAVYAIIFALMLLSFECRFRSMEPVLRRNFGFLFTYRGRAAFIFFVGFVDFGMHDTLAWLAGFLMCVNGVVNVLIMCFHPDFRSGAMKSTMDPTQAYRSNLVEQNPQMAAKVGQFALHQAQSHPETLAHVGLAAAAGGGGGYVPPTPANT